MCQAVQENGISCRCYAVDTWKGDAHAGFYDESVFAEVSRYNAETTPRSRNCCEPRSTLRRRNFADQTVDLLHIDGLHTYEAVRHDFESWWPKVRPGGVVLIHDTCRQARGLRRLEALGGVSEAISPLWSSRTVGDSAFFESLAARRLSRSSCGPCSRGSPPNRTSCGTTTPPRLPSSNDSLFACGAERRRHVFSRLSAPSEWISAKPLGHDHRHAGRVAARRAGASAGIGPTGRSAWIQRTSVRDSIRRRPAAARRRHVRSHCLDERGRLRVAADGRPCPASRPRYRTRFLSTGPDPQLVLPTIELSVGGSTAHFRSPGPHRHRTFRLAVALLQSTSDPSAVEWDGRADARSGAAVDEGGVRTAARAEAQMPT